MKNFVRLYVVIKIVFVNGISIYQVKVQCAIYYEIGIGKTNDDRNKRATIVFWLFHLYQYIIITRLFVKEEKGKKASAGTMYDVVGAVVHFNSVFVGRL